MTISDCIMILAVLLGPILAVQATRYLDDKKEVRERKLSIFKTLMATRAYNVSWMHVEALNRIDLEFSKKSEKEREVIEAWKEYHDLLGNINLPADQWNNRRIDLQVELLHKMARVLDYDFDRTHIKNSSYSPRAHGETDEQQAALRRGFIEVLEGRKSFPMTITNLPEKDQS